MDYILTYLGIRHTPITTMSEYVPLTAENWWEMIPGRKEGGAKLLKRCIELLSWRVDFAMNVLLAYKELLECKISIEDFEGTLLEPSVPVYQMWSQHILDTQAYQKDCELLFGRIMHYDPNLYKDYQGRAARINRTMQLIYEKSKCSFVDPMVWHFGPTMPFAHMNHLMSGESPNRGESDTHSQLKRPRTDPYAAFASYHSVTQTPPAFNKKYFQSDKVAKNGKGSGHVTLCIFKSTDGGAMDNKVTLDRDQQLRSVLDYYRFRCIWRNRRLDLHCTPNELDMGPVENIVLTSIHIDEVITLWFRDWNGNLVAKELKMRETIGDAYADQAQELGVDPSKLIFTFRGNRMSITSNPLLFQLDHGDVLDVSLEKSEEETIISTGEEKKDQRKDDEA